MPPKKHRRSPKKRRRLWQDEDMVKAMESVRNGNSVRGAAIEFSVPRKTLEDRVSGRVRHGAKPGVPTVLTEIEEDSLVTYLVHMASCGFPLTRTMVKAFAWAIAKRSGTGERFNPDHGPSEHWWSNFMKRHPKLALRKTDSLESEYEADCGSMEVCNEDSGGPSSGRPQRRRNLPARFREEDEDGNDGVLCALCGSNEPDSVKDGVIFWIDCEKCDAWVHNVCAFGKNTASRKYMCPKCSDK